MLLANNELEDYSSLARRGLQLPASPPRSSKWWCASLEENVSDHVSRFFDLERKARTNAVAMQIRKPIMPTIVAIWWVMTIPSVSMLYSVSWPVSLPAR
jgi:hypothetical protein